MQHSTHPTPEGTALVLGGGGIAGIAWEAGILATLMSAGIDVHHADRVIGTSAGSAIGALLRFNALDTVRDTSLLAQLGYVDPALNDQTETAAMVSQAVAGARSDTEARARIGHAAQEITGGQSDASREEMFARAFGTDAWPDAPLTVTAVDAEDGSFHLFTASDGIPLSRAVAASCSVPFVWSPVMIGGRPYVDGGLRSGTNADAATGAARVLIIATGPESASPTGPHLDAAVATLRARGAAVEVIVADEHAIETFGQNTLELSVLEPALLAGTEQAASLTERIRAFWS